MTELTTEEINLAREFVINNLSPEELTNFLLENPDSIVNITVNNDSIAKRVREISATITPEQRFKIINNLVIEDLELPTDNWIYKETKAGGVKVLDDTYFIPIMAEATDKETFCGTKDEPYKHIDALNEQIMKTGVDIRVNKTFAWQLLVIRARKFGVTNKIVIPTNPYNEEEDLKNV